MEISRIRHAWPEKKGFNLYRRNGMDEYTFLHFWKPVYMLVDGETILTEPNAVIIIGKPVPHHFYSPDTDLVHDWFHFDGEDAADFIAASGLKTDTVYYPKNCGFITDIVKTMEGELFGAEKHSEEIMLSYMAILFRLIDRHEDDKAHGGANKPVRIALLRPLQGDFQDYAQSGFDYRTNGLCQTPVVAKQHHAHFRRGAQVRLLQRVPLHSPIQKARRHYPQKVRPAPQRTVKYKLSGCTVCKVQPLLYITVKSITVLRSIFSALYSVSASSTSIAIFFMLPSPECSRLCSRLRKRLRARRPQRCLPSSS